MSMNQMSANSLKVSKENAGQKTAVLRPGWPDLAIFCQSGYFWRLIMIFWKDEAAKNNVYFLGYFLFKKIY
jgi:hypothetical protein